MAGPLRPRLTRSRLLLGSLALCLLLWSIKTIHRATQPKYQGKTAQEWFAAYELKDAFPTQDAHAEPFKQLGTDAVWFLWNESSRKDSALTAWVMEKKDRLLKTNRGLARNHEEERQLKATLLIRALGSATDPLVPTMITKLQAQDPDVAQAMAWHLGALRPQPALAVPALLQSLSMTNRNSQQKISHIQALGGYGRDAMTALPVLRAELANTSTATNEVFWLNHAILKINGPGPELAYFTNQIQLGSFQSVATAWALADLGTNASPATPLLIQLAHSLTNSNYSNYVMEAVHKIDPEGTHQKP